MDARNGEVLTTISINSNEYVILNFSEPFINDKFNNENMYLNNLETPNFNHKLSPDLDRTNYMFQIFRCLL